MSFSKNKSFFTTSLLVLSTLFATTVATESHDNYTGISNDCCCDFSPFCGTFSVRGEYLYWQPVITGMSYALTRTSVDVPFSPFGPGPSTIPNNIAFQNVDFNYGPGYRIGGRYTLANTQWDVDVDYTDFQKKAKESVLADDVVFIDTLWDALSIVRPTEAIANFKTDMKLVNTCIGKTLSCSDCFSIRPSIGFQWYRLHNTEKIQYIGTSIIADETLASNTNIQLLNRTRGYGLVAGLDAFWKLPCCFELFGAAKYGIGKTKFSVSQNQQTNIFSLDEIDLASTSRFKAIAHNIDVKTGLNWNYQFNFQNHCWNINLFVAYEMSLWLQNIQISRVLSLGTGFSDANTTNIGNVGFHGLTTGLGVSF